MKRSNQVGKRSSSKSLQKQVKSLPIATPSARAGVNAGKFRLVLPPVEADFICDTPEMAVRYWQLAVRSSAFFNPDAECLVALLLNTRRRVIGHQLISIGTLDTVMCHPREVFRGAVKAAASALIVMHNLCAATHKLCYVECGFM